MHVCVRVCASVCFVQGHKHSQGRPCLVNKGHEESAHKSGKWCCYNFSPTGELWQTVCQTWPISRASNSQGTRTGKEEAPGAGMREGGVFSNPADFAQPYYCAYYLLQHYVSFVPSPLHLGHIGVMAVGQRVFQLCRYGKGIYEGTF